MSSDDKFYFYSNGPLNTFIVQNYDTGDLHTEDSKVLFYIFLHEAVGDNMCIKVLWKSFLEI